MSNLWKTYRVRFSERNFYTIDLTARSKAEAVSKAETIYDVHGGLPFELDISEGGTEGWDAEEVVS